MIVGISVVRTEANALRIAAMTGRHPNCSALWFEVSGVRTSDGGQIERAGARQFRP